MTRGPSTPDPLFGPAVGDEVPDVEIPPDPVTLERVDVLRGLPRTQQEVVPDVLERDVDPRRFGVRDHP